MKVEYVNPFVESIEEIFENMLECTPKMGEVQIMTGENDSTDLVGIIGMSGTAQCTVVVILPVRTALAIIGKMAGAELKAVDSLVIDGVGEFVNIIAGYAKSKFTDHSLNLSLPTVIRGNVLMSQKLHAVEWLELPFSSDLGDFSLAISFKPIRSAESEVKHESVNSR